MFTISSLAILVEILCLVIHLLCVSSVSVSLSLCLLLTCLTCLYLLLLDIFFTRVFELAFRYYEMKMTLEDTEVMEEITYVNHKTGERYRQVLRGGSASKHEAVSAEQLTSSSQVFLKNLNLKNLKFFENILNFIKGAEYLSGNYKIFSENALNNSTSDHSSDSLFNQVSAMSLFRL